MGCLLGCLQRISRGWALWLFQCPICPIHSTMVLVNNFLLPGRKSAEQTASCRLCNENPLSRIIWISVSIKKNPVLSRIFVYFCTVQYKIQYYPIINHKKFHWKSFPLFLHPMHRNWILSHDWWYPVRIMPWPRVWGSQVITLVYF